MMVDVLDDVVWGDNASKASTALFAGDPSVTGQSGLETSTFNIKRAWMEFDIPVGKVRVGRQPSQWGLGILGNDGNGFDDLFERTTAARPSTASSSRLARWPSSRRRWARRTGHAAVLRGGCRSWSKIRSTSTTATSAPWTTAFKPGTGSAATTRVSTRSTIRAVTSETVPLPGSVRTARPTKSTTMSRSVTPRVGTPTGGPTIKTTSTRWSTH